MAEPETYANLIQAGDNALRTGSSAEAQTLFTRALELASNDSERALAHAFIGRGYASQGHHTEAQAALAHAAQVAAEVPAARARVRLHAGVAHWLAGNMTAARAELEQAQQDLQRQGLVRDRAATLGNLGAVYSLIGEYQLAINTMRQGIELMESLNDLVRVAINCSNLAICYQHIGATARAEEHLHRALTLAQLIDAPGVLIDPTRTLGLVRAAEGDFKAAYAHLEEALTQARKYQRRDLELQILGSLADVHLQSGAVEQAQATAATLLGLAGTIAPALAEARLLLGQCALARGEQLNALGLLELGILDAEAGLSRMVILRLHAALSRVNSQPAIADLHRRIALEIVGQIADGLNEKELRATFLQMPLVRALK